MTSEEFQQLVLARFADVEARLAAINARIDELHTRLDGIVDGIAKLRRDIATHTHDA